MNNRFDQPMRKQKTPIMPRWIARLKERKEELFWIWIGYQTIKGLTTTSLFWIPLLMWWADP